MAALSLLLDVQPKQLKKLFELRKRPKLQLLQQLPQPPPPLQRQQLRLNLSQLNDRSPLHAVVTEDAHVVHVLSETAPVDLVLNLVARALAVARSRLQNPLNALKLQSG